MPFNDSAERPSIKKKPSATGANTTNNLVKLTSLGLLGFGVILLNSLSGGVAPTGHTNKDIVAVFAGVEMTQDCTNSGCIKVISGAAKDGTIFGSGSGLRVIRGDLAKTPLCELSATGAIQGSNCVITPGVTISGVLSSTSGDARYVNAAGDTMTGTLVIQNGSVHTPTATPLLNTRGTSSGADVYATKSLRSSGSLVVEGSVLFEGNLTVRSALSGSTIFATKSLSTSGSTVLEGTVMMPRPIEIALCDGATACATGSGAGFIVPSDYNNMKLTSAVLACGVKGVTNLLTVQVINITQNKDLFSTKITVDSAEANSTTAATPYVIATAGSADVLTTNDVLMPRIDAVHSTPCKVATILLRVTPQ